MLDALEDSLQHGQPDNSVAVHVAYGTLGDEPAFGCLLDTNTACGAVACGAVACGAARD